MMTATIRSAEAALTKLYGQRAMLRKHILIRRFQGHVVDLAQADLNDLHTQIRGHRNDLCQLEWKQDNQRYNQGWPAPSLPAIKGLQEDALRRMLMEDERRA